MPTDISSTTSLVLIISTLFTSAFAAVLGQGGGLMLMSVLAQVIPISVLILVHGIIQAASNSSRAVLSAQSINWKIITPILIGIFAGALIVTPFLFHFQWDWMQAIIGAFILWSVWGKKLNIPATLPYGLGILGVMQGALGLLLGATGPLGNALLLSKGLKKDALIASNAVIMFTSHLVKIIVFFLIGVSLAQYWTLVLLLCAAAVAGSYIGNHLRSKLPEKIFLIIFKSVLSLLALRMVYMGATSV